MAAERPCRLRARGLLKRLGGRTVVDRVDLEVLPGEVVGLLGPNGAGKTTIFKMLIGLVRPDDGRVSLGDRDLTDLPTHRRALLGLGYLPQQPSAFLGLSVMENLQLVLELCGRPGEDAGPLVERLGLVEAAGRRAALLSGGERRRLELCRLLATRPTVALLDEPFKGLDRDGVEIVTQALRGIAAEGRGVLLTDHAVAETRGLCTRVYVVEQGRVVAHGPPDNTTHGLVAPLVDGRGPDRRREWHSN